MIFKIFETHFSFSSRFSRFLKKFLCLLSIFEIFLINILIIDHWAWYVKICFYHFIIWPLSFSPHRPTGSWPHPVAVSDKDCRNGKFLPLWFYVVCLTTSSVLNNFWWRKQPRACFSLSTLEVRDKNFNILFLLSRLDLSAFLMSLSTLVNGYIHISILF